MIGNTSSGIIEAASYNKPVINVGNRQKGRLAGANVVHADNNADKIVEAVGHALQKLTGKKFDNLYGDGNATEKVMAVLKTIS
jgi:UDP-N-acetylglucosamine 2-epimerase